MKDSHWPSGVIMLFDGTADSFRQWRQIGPGNFALSDSAIIASGTTEFGLLYYPHARFGDFMLRTEFSLQDPARDNSGVFVRFRDPLLPPTLAVRARDQFNDLANNPAWIAAHSGFEIQIDEQARGNEKLGQRDGLDKHRTGAIYAIPTGQRGEPTLQRFERGDPVKRGEWQLLEIQVIDNEYVVRLNGKRTTRFINTDPLRGLCPEADPTYGYVGIQCYAKSHVSFRNIRAQNL